MIDLMNINDPCTSVALLAGASNSGLLGANANFVSVYNPAATVTYVRCGGASVVADATSTWIPPGQAISFRKNVTQNYIAGFNPVDNVELLVQYGSGI